MEDRLGYFWEEKNCLPPPGIWTTGGPDRSVVSIRNMLSWLHEDDEWLNWKYLPRLIFLPHKSTGVTEEYDEQLSVNEQANCLPLH